MDALSERSYHMKMGEVHLPGLDLYMLNDPDEVKRVMVSEAKRFPKSALLAEALRPLLGNSVFSVNGEEWAQQREMVNPAFAQARLQVAFPAMQAATQDLLNRLHSRKDGRLFDVDAEMTRVTADIIFRTIFSRSIDDEDARKVFAAFNRFQALAPKLMLPSIYKKKWLVMPWDRRRSVQAANEVRSLLGKFVETRYQAHLRGDEAQPEDILTAFMKARNPATGQAFEFEALVDQVAILFLAGHETSASALTWAMHLLSKCPEVQERVCTEFWTEIPTALPDHSDIKKLKLTWDVVRETLRLYPPVGFFARDSAEQCAMRDKIVPQGSTLVISPWLLHRHRDIWQEPDGFDPDRYSRDEEISRKSVQKAYCPFGMGPRVCVGASFAMQEAVLILASLVGNFRFEAVGSREPMPVGRLTIRPDKVIRLKYTRRDH